MKQAILLIVISLTCQLSFADSALTDSELKLLKIFTPWPPKVKKDMTNQFSQNKRAIELGEMIFFDEKFSKNQSQSCASCHQPNKAFGDSLVLSKGLNELTRHTPSLMNLANNRWFGWDGSSDSLWLQSLRPLLSEDELGLTFETIKSTFLSNQNYKKLFSQLKNHQHPETINAIPMSVDIAKILAAYQETLISQPSKFDRFINSTIKNKRISNELNIEEQKGLKIFINKGQCHICHFGPKLSNNEFENIGISYFIDSGVDKGRYGGIEALKKSPYNLTSQFNDSLSPDNEIRMSLIKKQSRNFGEFKVPSLRNISKTAPYMHNGSLKTLNDVIDHYSELNLDRLHTDSNSFFKPLNLNKEEKSQLKAFLKTL